MTSLDEVMVLARRLEKSLGENDSFDVVQSLEALSRIEMSVSALQTSKLGKTVATLRAHENERVSALARDCLAIWMRIARNSGVTAAPKQSQFGGATGADSARSTRVVEPEQGESTPSQSLSDVVLSPSSIPSTPAASASQAAPAVPSVSNAFQPAADTTPLSPRTEYHVPTEALARGAALPGARTRTWKVLMDTLSRAVKKAISAGRTDGGSPAGSPSSAMEALQNDQHVPAMCASTALSIEDMLWSALGGGNPAKPLPPYSEQFRTLALGLVENPSLVFNIMTGSQSIDMLLRATNDDLASNEARAAAEASRREHVESVMLDWREKNKKKLLASAGIADVAGMFPCGRCKSTNTDYTEKQTRSADEPTTKFCVCNDCGNRWKFC